MTNREGLILEKWIDPQTRIHREFVVSLDDPRFAKDSTENTGIETRFAAKPSNWNALEGSTKRYIFFFFFYAHLRFERERFEDSTRSRVFQIVNFVRPFYSRQISSIKRFRGDLFEFSRRENVLGMQNTFGSETLLKVVSREYFSQIDELVELAKNKTLFQRFSNIRILIDRD